MREIQDGYGNPITDLDWLSANLFIYKDFDTAAPLVHHTWKRHHLHKELKQNRIFKSEMIIIVDPEMFSNFSEHKKFYISDDEIARIRQDVATRPKRNLKRCEWCERQIRYCLKDPCEGRYRTSPEYGESLDRISTFVDRFIERNAKAKRPFSEFNRQGERKGFGNNRRNAG